VTDYFGPYSTSPWSEAEWFDHMAPAMPSGVIGATAASYDTGGLPLILSGLNWSVGPGTANVAGSGFRRDSAAGGAVTPNTHTSQSRRDRVVLRRDLAIHQTVIALKEGTPAASPTAPSLEQDPTGVWEEALFSFLVPPNSGSALTGVVDERSWLAANLDLQEVNDGLDAVAAQAAQAQSTANSVSTRVTALEADSGWVDVPVTAGHGAYQNPAVRKIGKTVYARGGFTNTGLEANAEEQVATIPSGFQPATTLVISPGMSSAGSTGRLVIRSDRSVTVGTGNPVASYFKMDGASWLTD
jgi:hypothetical protein